MGKCAVSGASRSKGSQKCQNPRADGRRRKTGDRGHVTVDLEPKTGKLARGNVMERPRDWFTKTEHCWESTTAARKFGGHLSLEIRAHGSIQPTKLAASTIPNITG